MCLECDGYSYEEAMQALDLQIRVHGWALVQVAGDGTSWCYTVGLVENFGHPELSMIDVALEYQRPVITELVDSVKRLGMIAPWVVQSERLTCVEVHADHLNGDLFGRWIGRHRRPLRAGEMLQIVLPPDFYCDCHALQIRRLDQPGPLPGIPRGPNRAERRRRNRRGRAA
jgi:hypothetical protein